MSWWQKVVYPSYKHFQLILKGYCILQKTSSPTNYCPLFDRFLNPKKQLKGL